MSNLDEIYQFRAVAPGLGTAGQPTREQFAAIASAGFKTVINLALPTSDNAIPDEGSVVTGQGMSYVHIPVDFGAPASQDFQVFRRTMEIFGDQPVFVHCAANMRVSAFVFLYRVLDLQIPVAQAKGDLNAIWNPNEVWARFIESELARNHD